MADKRIPALPSATVPLVGTEVLPVVQSGITDQVSVANLTAGRAVTMLSNTMVSASAVNDVDKTGGGAYSYRAKGNDQANVRFRFENTGGQIYELVGGNPGASNAGFAIFDATASATRMYLSSTGDITVNTGNLVIGTAAKGIDFSANTHAAGMTSELLNWYEEGVFTPTVFGTGTAGTGTYTFQVGRYVRIGKVVQFQASLGWSAHTGTGNFGGVGGLPFSSVSTADNYSIPSIYVSDLALTALNTIQGFIGPSTSTIALRQVPVGGGTASVIAFDTNVSALIITGSYIAA